MSSSRRTAAEQDTVSTHTLTAAYHNLTSLSLAAFRAQFKHTYEHTKASTIRTHYTIGVSLSTTGDINAISEPETRCLSSENVETHTPVNFEEHDVYLTVLSDTLSTSVQEFRNTIEIAFLEQVVLAETHPSTDAQLPAKEYQKYRNTVEAFHSSTHSDS